MPQDTTSTHEFTPGLQAPDIRQFVPTPPPGFHSFPEWLFDQALKEFTTQDTADQVAADCAVAFDDPDNPYTQHVHDALRMLVCHAQAARVEREFGESILRRFREAAL